jgi:hypothetical protein
MSGAPAVEKPLILEVDIKAPETSGRMDSIATKKRSK